MTIHKYPPSHTYHHTTQIPKQKSFKSVIEQYNRNCKYHGVNDRVMDDRTSRYVHNAKLSLNNEEQPHIAEMRMNPNTVLTLSKAK